ncbi:hypothetical protein [Arenibacter certesii]|uniref:Lipocalin-like domain-containing protein n=1 Tax=Arenibacter certesii TaxID=228955 RepID=A0A918MMQ1_9FLAO|nr:hypothetical protein [Arenibacter certesii]GGW37076.1 hypothetical protein GCM10007383_22420 [Arenibacter certesii]
MKTLSLFKIMVIAIIIFACVGCSSSDGGGTVFIPGFNATWPVEGTNDEYRMDLQPNDANKNVPSGVFNGREEHDNNSALDGNPLSGSFNGLDIEFTITRANNVKVKYKGKMTPISETNHFINRINLTSSEGSIVLVR